MPCCGRCLSPSPRLLLCRGRAFPASCCSTAVAHLPIILPPVLVGFVLLMLLGRRGPVGALLAQAGIQFAFTCQGCGARHCRDDLSRFRAQHPPGLRSHRPRPVSKQPAVLRAGPLDRFFSVALPLAGPGILAGMVMAFATALGEFGAVITFAANIPGKTQTLPLAIYAVLQQPGGEAEAGRLATLSFAAGAAGPGGGGGVAAPAGRLQRMSLLEADIEIATGQLFAGGSA